MARSFAALAAPATLAAAVVVSSAFPLACDRAHPTPLGERPHDAGRIVVTERSAVAGGLLVLVGEDGARLGDVTSPVGDGKVLDTSAVWSPDGRFLVFASSRGRAHLEESSLWVIEARAGGAPRRLTNGGPVDREACFSPDGRALVFASNRDGGFDLWRLDLTAGADGWPVPAGPPRRLSMTAADERAPAWSPDGARIAYMAADRSGSTLWTMPAGGGEPTRLTEGSFDVTPMWAPDGSFVAFAAPAEGRRDADLYAVAPDGTGRRVLVSEPLADETAPRFSADGRFLFATAVLRSSGGDPILSSVVYLDRRDAHGTLRALQDVVLRQRLGPALAPEPLFADTLNQGPPYDVEELRRSLCGPGGLAEPRPAVCKEKAR